VVPEPSVSDVEVNELSVETPLLESESVTEIPAVILNYCRCLSWKRMSLR